MNSEPLYTIDEVAAHVQVSRRTIERRIADGELRVVRLTPRCVRVPESAFNAYIAGAQEPPGEGGTVHAFPTTQGGTA